MTCGTNLSNTHGIHQNNKQKYVPIYFWLNLNLFFYARFLQELPKGAFVTDVHRIRSIASCLEMTSEMTRRKVLRTLSFWSLIKHRVIQITKYVQVLHVQKLWVRFHVVRNPQYNKRQEVPRSKKSRRNQENNSISIKNCKGNAESRVPGQDISLSEHLEKNHMIRATSPPICWSSRGSGRMNRINCPNLGGMLVGIYQRRYGKHTPLFYYCVLTVDLMDAVSLTCCCHYIVAVSTWSLFYIKYI